MKRTRLFLVIVLACLALIYVALVERSLLPGVAKAKRSFSEAAKLSRIPLSKIDRSPVPRTLVKQAMTLYPAALEHAPALPAPPMENGRIGSHPF
ncbi:hypothetical protein ACFL2Q_15570 [Thermodesulfobacteriota bacterium]